MKCYRLLLLGIIYFNMATYSSCRKLDFQSTKSVHSDRESRFFGRHLSSNPSLKAIKEHMARQNEKYHFVDNIIKAVGYPYWNKALTYTSFSAASRGSSGDSTSYFYIPFVKENEDGTGGNVVNATLIFRISPEDTSYKWVCDWQYRDTTNTGLTKTEIPLLIMMSDYEVFGLRNYQLLDTTIFDGRARTVHLSYLSNGTTNSSGRNSILEPTIQICITYQAPQYGWVSGGCPPGDPCNPYIEITECYFVSFGNGTGGGWNNSGGGNPPPGPGGGGGGGGGGGNWVPPPCTGAACNPGWAPEPEINIFPDNPCKVVDSLMTTPNFPVFYSNLRSFVNVNYEIGYFFNNPFDNNTFTYDTATGASGTLRVDMNPAVPIDGAVHSHNNDSLRLSVFTFDDFYKLYEWFKNGMIRNLKTFTFGMVSDSTAYIMMITDSTAFANFGNKFLNNTEEDLKIFRDSFYIGYDISESKSTTENEKAFLNALQGTNSGISLFRGNSTLTQFTRIRVNNNNQVRFSPCN